MTAASMLPDTPPPRVKHGWRCKAAGPYRNEEHELSNGQTVVVTVCESCRGSDVTDRIRRAAAAERGDAT
jgi:hypothetical protein